jgi:hypothetical protein
MSKSSVVAFNCPKCQNQIQATVWSSLNFTLNPELKPKLLDETLFDCRCTSCGKTINSEYEILCHDMDKHYMVWLKFADSDKLVSFESAFFCEPPFPARSASKYTLRVVLDRKQLNEKIAVFDSGLDDKSVELTKQFLWMKVGLAGLKPKLESFLFRKITVDSRGNRFLEFTFSDEAQTRNLSCKCPWEEYGLSCSTLKTQFNVSSDSKPQWEIVDHQYAFDLVNHKPRISRFRIVLPPKTSGDSKQA